MNPTGIDNDKDGFFAGQDCNDGNTAIRPGAVEVRGNNLDENCDGLAEPFPTLTSGVASKWDVKGSSADDDVAAGHAAVPQGLEGRDQVLG